MRKLVLSSTVALLALSTAALAQQGRHGSHGPDVNAAAAGYIYNRSTSNAQAANAAVHVDANVYHTQSGGSSWTVNGAHQFQASAVNGVASANSQGGANQAANSSYANGSMQGAASGNAVISDQGGFAQIGNLGGANGTMLTPTTGSAQGSASGGFSGGGSYTNTNSYGGSLNASGSYNAAQTSNSSGYGAAGAISYRN